MDERGLGKQLQSARQAAGLTQQALCQRANLSFSTLTKIERGAIKSPSIFTIQAIATALNMSLDALMGNASLPASLARRDLRTTKSGVRFVYFDVNGCLIRFYQRAFGQIAEKYDIPSDVVETAFWHYNDAACRGEFTTDDFNAAFAKRIGIPAIDWADYYLAAAEKITEMHELVKWTAEHYRIGLLTNIMPGLLDGLKALDKVPAIKYDATIDSSELGTIKPEAAIYAVAEERAGVPASEILFIDDTKANLTAAEARGWHVIWFDYGRPEESVVEIRKALEPSNN
ncbi:MAG: HAD-IA family hydrolase [Patescibacteria group bacterium]|nr:HAD-IA family hydrolase [Patescibacteria group bacterium]